MRTLQLTLALLLLGGQGSALAGDPFAGREIYQQHCQRCHGADGRGEGGTAPLDRNTILQPDFQLLQTLQQGVGIIPAYSGLLSEEQLRNAIAYLRTMP